MRLLSTALALAAVAIVALSGVQAGVKDGKVTLKGTITCAKCGLGKEDTCMTVLVTKDAKKQDVVLYFDPTAGKKYHSEICAEAKPGTVEGTVKTQGEKKIITPTKVTFE